MCLFVTRSPGSHLTDPALIELDLLIELFEGAVSMCRAANDLLVSVSKSTKCFGPDDAYAERPPKFAKTFSCNGRPCLRERRLCYFAFPPGPINWKNLPTHAP